MTIKRRQRRVTLSKRKIKRSFVSEILSNARTPVVSNRGYLITKTPGGGTLIRWYPIKHHVSPGQKSYDLAVIRTPGGHIQTYTPGGRIDKRTPGGHIKKYTPGGRAFKRTPGQGPLSEIVINLKTPVRTPGGSILKSVSDKISKSPGTQRDHDATRLIVSAVPARGQVLLEKKLSVVQTVNPGLWSRFKTLISENKADAIAIAAIIASLSVTAIIRGVFPNSAAAGVITAVSKGIRQFVNGRTPLHLKILEEKYGKR